MKLKLLYCLALLSVVFILGFTLVKREGKISCPVACDEMEAPIQRFEGTTNNEFIFFQSLSRFVSL